MSYVKLSAEAKQGSPGAFRSWLQGGRRRKACSCCTVSNRVSMACVTSNCSCPPCWPLSLRSQTLPFQGFDMHLLSSS